MAPFNLVTRIVLLLVLALVCQGARADTAIRLLKSFAGNVNFAGIQQTIRNKGNNKPCEVFDPGVDRWSKLSGIPASATILSAQLYWAGSNHNPDFNVIFDDVAVRAEDDRRYYSTTIGNDFSYYSGAADVTAQVKRKFADKKNDKYTFRGLTVETGSPYCSVEGVLGGFALLVIYSDSSEPFRMLNLYEGFQYMRYSGITLNLSGFRVPNPIGSATGRVAHITWEGDGTLDGLGENLRFNGYEMTDHQNPTGNQFNSRSNIDGDPKSYGIDFDAYTVGEPVIKGGQTTASTRYESGQDLVLLSAEVVALPNVPMSDLSISMRVKDELALGETARYTLTVANNGPSTETGPTVITTTLPAGLTFVSSSGTDWTCSRAGQVVTCSNPASILAGKSLPDLILNTKVVAGGTITVSATVSGAMYDPALGNNTAIEEREVSDGALTYVFTNKKCDEGIALETPEKCSATLRPIIAGETRTIYLTSVVGQMPTTPAKTVENFEFRLRCVRPTTTGGKKARYADVELPECETDKWAAATVKFDGVSAELAFTYADVGELQLQLRPAGTQKVSSSEPFKSVPHGLRITTVVSKLKPVPGVLDDLDDFVIRAGDPFTATLEAFATDNSVTPNFGKQGIGEFAMPAVSIGALSKDAKDAMTHSAVEGRDELVGLPALGGEIAPIIEGKATGSFTWDDVGIVTLTPGLAEGKYLGLDVSPVLQPARVGRFIPHHFKTDIVQRMACPTKMGCTLDSAAYSKEPFAVTVTARSLDGSQTMNYRGHFAGDLILSAWDKAGGQVAKTGLKSTKVDSKEFADGVATGEPNYELPNGFALVTPPQTQWGAPETIFVRAEETEGSKRVSSDRGDDSLEGGIRIVNGRLSVPSAHGSERLDLPLQVAAQYWTGSNWELSSKDSYNLINPTKAVFIRLPNSLVGSELTLVPGPLEQKLSAGTAKFSVRMSPAKAGSVDLTIGDVPWLPSTKGRLKFGTYKSPLIYLRELH